MTEAEWLACDEPAEMFDLLDRSRRPPDRSPRLVRRLRQEVLNALRRRATRRALRLFGCACCRRLWHLLPPLERTAVEAAEGYADDPDGEVRLSLDDRAVVLRERLRISLPQDLAARGVRDYMTLAARCQLEPGHLFSPLDGVRALAEATGRAAVLGAGAAGKTAESLQESARRAEGAAHCDLLRDVLGNPFRPVRVDPTWRTPQRLPWRPSCTSRGTSPRCRSWPMHYRTPGATTRTS